MIMHSKNNNKTYIIRYVCSLIPLILYGMYKNGYLIYQKGLIEFYEIFKVVYLIFIGLLLNMVINYLFDKEIKIDYSYLNILILCLFLSPNTNIFIFIVSLLTGLIIIKLIEKHLKINTISFLKLLIVGISLIFSKYSYLNILESKNIYSFNTFDILFGRNIGGIASTNIILGLIIYLYLCLFTNFKKEIPLIAYITYFITSLIIILISPNVNYNILFSSTSILGFIFVATDSFTTPVKGKIIVLYSIMLGLITSILTIFVPYEAVFISSLILSILYSIISNKR